MRLFVLPVGVSALIVVGALIFAGPSWAFLLLTLAVLEVSLSFDNAVINSIYLERMNERWRKLFLTVGILVAVFGMRLVFPVLVVAVSAHLSIGETIGLALHDSERYAAVLTDAHDEIATFGAVFLGMIFLDWILDERDVHWLGPIERSVAGFGQIDYLAVATMLTIMVVVHPNTLLAGVVALVTYLAVSAVSSYFEKRNERQQPKTMVFESMSLSNGLYKSGPGTLTITPLVKGSVGAFLYLELMDASFSFDGVMAAFAISTDVVLIALGLGIGALFVRTLTVYLVEKGVLADLIHLEHGAHWAIGVLSALMFVSLSRELPELLTAALSLSTIGAAFATSIHHNRRQEVSA